MFDIKNKVAIVTGGASGIGLSIVKEFFKNGIKGVTIADINNTLGEQAIKEINEEFKENRILFVRTNVASYKKFKNVFEKTIEHFGYVDILVNNAGIYNDQMWVEEVAVNLGVVLADINITLGDKCVNELKAEFGENTVWFVRTDTTNYEELENAFLKTIEKFGNIDILVNNAGIYRDGIWEKEIAININGTIQGILLGIHKYIPEYKQDHEGLIVNVSSVNAIESKSHIPIYCGTKLASLSFTRSWGVPDIYKRTKVRCIAVCPGPTETPSVLEGDMERNDVTLGEMYLRIRRNNNTREGFIRQKSSYVADETIKIMRYAPNGSIWMIENGWPAYQYIFPDRSTMKNNLLVES